MSTLPTPAPSKRWTRSYPPLALIGVAVLVAVLILPSSLNLPQSNPSTVLEYAPVPPQDENPPPPADGNLSSLGLGSSDTLAVPLEPPPAPPPLDESGLGARPNQKQCVGNPPRQTEDPSSPPCVPFFEGDNFGATYQGVTGEEITVLSYFDAGGYGPVGQLEGSPPAGTYVDIDAPRLPNCPPDQGQTDSDPKQCDHVIVRMMKGISRYFNTRFQTYKRRVHFWVYFTAADSAAERRGDAVANWEKLKPFAVIDHATFNGFNAEYQQAMTQLGVLSFASTEGSLPASFYREVAPLAWAFYPDIEHWSEMYASYVCQKVLPFPVRRFNQGNGSPNGEKRKFGMWWTNDPATPDLTYFADITREKLIKCGVDIAEEATFSHSGFAVDGNDTGTEATQAAARFSSRGVTTILYMGGVETRLSAAADGARYYPEIIIAGDLDVDSNAIGRLQNQNVWRNAWGQTFHVRINRLEDSPGFRAYKEGDPGGDDAAGLFARDSYRDIFMLYQAIQVSGPKLTPEKIDAGFHAIPERASTDPFVAAFFFDSGDYTSVKDSAEQWWDPNGRPVGGGAQPGCWRMVREGKRYLAGDWEGGDVAFKNADDPCTAYGGSFRLRAG